MPTIIDNQRSDSPEISHTNHSSRKNLELLYNISRELAAALDLRKVLQRVLMLSMQNVGAITGSIIVLDASGQPIESAIIIGTKIHEHTTQQLKIIFEQGLAGWVAQKHTAVLIPDTSADKRWLRRPDDDEKQTGAKSAVSAPILARDQLIGVLTLVHPKPGFFNPDHLELSRAIADQAGIAILNARLYTDSQRQTSIMTALANSSVAITGSLNLEEVLQSILDQISQALRVEVVSLALIEPQTDELVFHASTGKHSQNVVGVRLKVGQGVAGWVAKEGVGAVVPDTSKDHRFYPKIDNFTGFKTRAIACAPIHWRGQVIGILEALNPLDGFFEPDALLVLSGIGGLAGTAIRHAQLFERLQAAHQRYRELFESNIDAILITDWVGNILEANRQAERLTNYERDTLCSKKIEQLNVIDSDLVWKGFSALSSGETISYESTLENDPGLCIPVHVYARKVHIDGVPHLQWILHDITERKNLETLRNDLISMIYHDLRSPLANVVSSLDVLETMLPLEEDPALKSLLGIAVRSTERIQRLTNSLLDMRRIEVGQTITNLQPVSPYLLVKDSVEAIQTTADTKNQEIKLNIKQRLPAVWADADMIKRVLINLLENGIKYTPQGSQITVGGKRDKDLVVMWVEDNGPGVPPAERERVFDKFTRLHRDTTRGFGLGLAYCRLAIEAHNGRIWVESSQSTGACFKFTLPIAGIHENPPTA
jgi:NtrC-family two-component system sensor histidine kinase KinB